jgi:branched-chain amino acid transport system permease protein
MTTDLLLQTAVNALSLGGTYALLAIGLALIFSILGMINFAHGDLMTVAGYALVATTGAFVSFGLAMALAVVVSAGFAILIERLAFRPVRGQSLSTMLLTSYALSVLLHVLFQNVIGPRPLAVATPAWLGQQVVIGSLSIGNIQLLSIGATVVLMTGLVLLLRFTTMGIAMRAASQDFAIAQLMGINANRAILTAFGISGVLAGVAGVLWVAQRGSVDPLMGFLPVIKAFIATVIGGLGSLPGAAIGGLLLGTIEVVLRSFLPDALLPFREAIALGMVIAVLLIRPNGLFGSELEQRQ